MLQESSLVLFPSGHDLPGEEVHREDGAAMALPGLGAETTMPLDTGHDIRARGVQLLVLTPRVHLQRRRWQLKVLRCPLRFRIVHADSEFRHEACGSTMGEELNHAPLPLFLVGNTMLADIERG